jgi:drug/metabolite transporter (DMT)-like permease
MTKNQKGGIAVSLAMAIYIFNDTCLKLVSDHMPISQILVLRGVVCVILAYMWVRYEGEGDKIMLAVKNPLIIFRGFADAACAFMFIGALSLGTMADMTAIGLTAPLIITALSIPMLGEKVGWRRWSAIFVGFIGMVLVMKPGGGFGLAGLLAFGAAVLLSFREVVTRKIKTDVPSVTVLFVCAACVMVFSLIPAPFETWVMPTFKDIALLSFAALTVITANYLMIISHRDTDISVIAPFRYSILLWSIISGMVIWGDKVDLIASIGMILIVASGLYTLHRERVVNKTTTFVPTRTRDNDK